LCLGSNATFSVTASGEGLGYQWELSINGGTSFAPIGGAIASSYTQNTITIAMNNNRYRVVVSGSCPPPVTSNAAILTVISPVTVTTNPRDTVSCETGNVTFSVAGNSTVPVIYQWQVSTNGGTTYTNLSDGGSVAGATTPTVTLSNVTVALNNNRYRALLSNATCTTPVASTGALLTVNARPIVNLTASPFINLLPGQSTTLTVTLDPPASGFNITWLKDNVVIPGVTSTTYVVDSVAIGGYQASIVNPVTGCANTSQVLTIGTSSSERLFIYPSPNNGQFTISYFNSAGGATQQTIAIFDAHGAQVYSAKVPVLGPYTLHNVNLRSVARGIYLVVVGDANGKKLVKEKILIH
jgi:hypothetical protein